MKVTAVLFLLVALFAFARTAEVEDITNTLANIQSHIDTLALLKPKAVPKKATTKESFNKVYDNLKIVEEKIIMRLNKLSSDQRGAEKAWAVYQKTHETNVKNLKTLYEKAKTHEEAVKKVSDTESEKLKGEQAKWEDIKKRFDIISTELVTADMTLKERSGVFAEAKKLHLKKSADLEHELKILRKMLKITAVHMK
jgi:hypothetical protein